MIYCSKHRLPENHKCPFDLKKKGKDIKSLDKPLYQDALEFMNNKLTVAKVYNYFTTQKMSKTQAIELLTYFLENNEDPDIRIISILSFEELNLKTNEVFKVLESCLLTDEDSEVRETSKKILLNLFPKKSKILLDWIREQNKNLNNNF